MARVNMKRTLCFLLLCGSLLSVAAQNSSEEHASHSAHMHGDMTTDHGSMAHDHGSMHGGHNMHDHSSMHEEATDDRTSISESQDSNNATGPGRPEDDLKLSVQHETMTTSQPNMPAKDPSPPVGHDDHANHDLHHQHHGQIAPNVDKEMMMMMDQAGSIGNMLTKKEEDKRRKPEEYDELLQDADDHGGHGGHDGHGGHGGHDDHKNGSGGGMMMHMKMYFHVGVEETVLFEEWHIQTVAGMAGSVFGIIVLAMFYEGLKYFREFLFKQYVSSMQFSTVAVTGESGRVTQVHKVERHRMMSLAHTIQTGLHVVQMVISYFLMLIFMTYNVWLCLAVIIGAGLGYFVFGWKKATVVDITEHCH